MNCVGAPVARGDGLASSSRALAETYDAALYDLDGVLYLGGQPVPHAAESVQAARYAGMRAAFVTNNASRRPDVVAEHLRRLGIPASADEVVTSAQAAGRYLAEHLPAGSAVLVLGTEALEQEVAGQGLVPVRTCKGPRGMPAGVAQGLSPSTSWTDVGEAALAVQAGALWVAGNADSTFPSPRGLLPGNGALVAALSLATGRQPVVVGKPSPELHTESLARVPAQRPLVVGDRLDTDVLGAVRAGADSLLVLTGVVDREQLLAATPGSRPSYVGADLRALLRPQPAVTVEGDQARCGGAEASYDGSQVTVRGDGVEALRAECALAWSVADRLGVPVASASTGSLRPGSGPSGRER